jgi:hypothetical protein
MKITYTGENEFDVVEIDVDEENSINIAKDIQKNRWRGRRKPLLDSLDIEFMKAIETDNKEEIRRIAGIKNELRNVTEIEMPETVDEIMEFWPDILK